MQLPARRYLALEGGRTAEPAWAAERRRRRPQEHGWRPSARSLGVVAQEVRMPAAPSSACPRPRPASGIQCPVSGASDQCPRLPVHGTAVQCPVRASERPGVRCPASGVGVRCLCVAASAVSGRSEVLERGGGQAAARLEWPGRRGRRLRPCPARRLPESAPRARSWRRWCWASRGVGLDLAVVDGGRWAVASSTAWPTRIGRVRARIIRWWEPVGSELASCGRLIGMRRANRSAGLTG